MTKVKRKKLNFAVKKDFQIWLLFRILITIAVSVVVATLILYFFTSREVGESFFNAHIELRKVSDLLIPVLLAGSCVSIISGALIAIFLPQRIAGPLYRLENNLKAVGEGNLTVATHLRSDDILQDFASTIEDTVVSVRLKIDQLKAVHSELSDLIRESDRHDLQRVLERENKILEALITDTEKFNSKTNC